MSCDSEFDEDAKYGLVDGTIDPGHDKEDAMEQMTGTYRKLNVDWCRKQFPIDFPYTLHAISTYFKK